MKSIQISAHTHTGRKRRENQDACIMLPLSAGNKTLAAVIDGVGGYAGGERAAAIAKNCIEQYMQTPSGNTLTMLREAVLFANNQVATERKKDQRFSEMCCVLTALVADALTQRICYVHVGDTRLYRFRNGILQKLTRDHSFVGIREDAGEISETEAMDHPLRNQILREVGSVAHRLDDEDFMDYGSDPLEPGDVLLLCSDGLTDMIRSEQVANVLSAEGSPDDKTARLVELANESGGYDNITVVLLELPDNLSAAKNKLTEPVESKDPARADMHARQLIQKKNNHWKKTLLLPVFLLFILVGGASWYFNTPKNGLTPAFVPFTDQSPAPAHSMHPDSNHINPLSIVRTLHPAPVINKKEDTLRISSTQNFADLKKYADSTGRTLVLVPEKNGSHFSAIAITGRSARAGDTLLLRNMRLAGFENGIDIHLPILLKTENLVFENTTHPFRYLFKPDEKHTSILFMNTP